MAEEPDLRLATKVYVEDSVAHGTWYVLPDQVWFQPHPPPPPQAQPRPQAAIMSAETLAKWAAAGTIRDVTPKTGGAST
ncbi:hypothetical protein [Amycolatopsis sp. NBC_01480]|uniref:hypothetical protein n=1 Tax=Amycolatopsis sp. NBC_01480 TaxID=2903562 RepID=UPI002E2E484E|nr:hypothetical protein [Amycolatopsis sp. NBC_01480]